MTTKHNDLTDGFYILSNSDGSEPCLVKIYSHQDFNNERRVVFGVWDGGGTIPLHALAEGTVLKPATVLVGETTVKNLDNTASVEQVPKDSQRLDYLEKTHQSNVVHLGNTWYSRAFAGQPHSKHKTLRDAIDASIALTATTNLI